MIITILQENLLKSLTRVSRILSTKPQLPVLQNILLETNEEGLFIMGTNLETTISITTRVKKEEDGGICVPSRLFLDLISTLPQDAVKLTVKENTLYLVSGNTKATIPGLSAQEFPRQSKKDEGSIKTMPKQTFLSTLHTVLFSAATDEGRPLLAGVLFKPEGDSMIVVTTDGYRLSKTSLPLSLSSERNLIIPARALLEMFKVAQEEKDVLEIGYLVAADNQFICQVGDTEIRTRLIDGEFPNFEKIVPSKHTTRANIDTQMLQKAVKSAAIFARDNSNIVKLFINNGQIIVSAATPNIGENSVVVDASIEGDGGEIAFNSRFLLEFLANYKEDLVVFEMTGSLNPGVFKRENDDMYLHIIMPVRTTQG